MDAIISFVEDVQTTMLAIAGTFAVIGVLGLGFMYLGSSLPIIADWKQSNPKAFTNVALGLVFLVFASGGGVLALLGG